MKPQIANNDDALEIEKFNAQAHEWWDPNGPFKPLHHMNPLRLEWVQSITPLQNKKLIDLGCGGGIFSESAAKIGAEVTGIDQAEKVIKVAKMHAANQNSLNVNYQLSNIETWTEQHVSSYDVVTAFEMLEHVPDPSQIVQNCFDLLKPGGYVFFSTINRNVKSFLFAILGAEYILKLLPKGTHQYNQFIKPEELARCCREKGFSLEAISGIRYNPWTQNFSLNEEDTSVNYFLAAQKGSL